MIKFHQGTHYEGHIKVKNKSIYPPSQKANSSTGTLKQLEMKLQTLNILHSISCFHFYAWSGETGQSKPVVLRRSQKFYTASRSPSPPWPLRLDIDLSKFSEGRNFLPKRYKWSRKTKGLPVSFLLPSFLQVWWCERETFIPSVIHLQYLFFPHQCCGGSRAHPNPGWDACTPWMKHTRRWK